MQNKNVKSSTMHDVARLAGVSIATVSSVINGKSGVSEKLTEKVNQAMATLDYHPDLVARSLKVGRTNVIGMVVPDVTNQFYTEAMRGVEDEARKHGYMLILGNSNEDTDHEMHLLSMLFSQRVDGVLLASSGSTAAYDRLTRRRFPIVFIDRVPVGCSERAVIIDNVGAAYEATRHLISLGHERIAIITGKLPLSTGSDRVDGYRKAMQEAHLPIREEYFQVGDFSLESGHQCGLNLMKLSEPPTAIFSCNNKMTLGLMRSLAELAIPCPDKVSVISFDDFEWAANFSPRLTTVAQPTYEIGQKAMQMLIRIICANKDGLDDNENILVLPAELHVRDSTAPPSP
ncbi:MAG TPA: LacI family DNA-binding transcriptional regulator [Pyrinomonadaceae bacterium]|nr:LacI family DNA-binding transcriptional regulator [Pyrinomonadaceae bacterium]